MQSVDCANALSAIAQMGWDIDVVCQGASASMQTIGLTGPIRKANPYRQMQKAIRTNSTAENPVKQELASHGPLFWTHEG